MSRLQNGLCLILDDMFLSLFVRSSEILSSQNAVNLRPRQPRAQPAAHRGGLVGVLDAVFALKSASVSLRFAGDVSIASEAKLSESKFGRRHT